MLQKTWLYGDDLNMKSMINEIDTYFLQVNLNLFGNLKTLHKENLIRPTSFGVIVPLTGASKKLGENYFLGLMESYKSTSIRLVVYDSGGSGINTIQITKNIIKNNVISRIIGL